MEHSLVREHLPLLNKVAHGTFQLIIEVNNETGESKHHLKMELPPEEAFESLAARLRPFTIGKESVYWAAVLDALENLLSKETLAEIVDIEGLRKYWMEVVEGSKVAQAYYVMTESGQLTDVQLADLWLNSDALHTQPIHSDVGKDLSLNERYRAAVRDLTLTTTANGNVRGSVRLQRTKSRRKREWVTGTPKSKTSKRTVPLPPWLAACRRSRTIRHPGTTTAALSH